MHADPSAVAWVMYLLGTAAPCRVDEASQRTTGGLIGVNGDRDVDVLPGWALSACAVAAQGVLRCGACSNGSRTAFATIVERGSCAVLS